MTYELEFDPRAWREWQLGETVKKQFKNKLQQIVQNPRSESARLSDLPDCYKIKLKSSGYRLVYEVIDERVVVSVVAVGKRERSEIYERAKKR